MNLKGVKSRVADQPEEEQQPLKSITQQEATAMEQDNEPSAEEMQAAAEMEVDQDATTTTTKAEDPKPQASPIKPTVKATPPPPSQPIRSKYASKIKQTTLQTSFAKTVPAPNGEVITTPVKEKKADEKPKAPGAPKKPKEKPKEKEEPKKEETEAEAETEEPKKEETEAEEPEQDPEKILKKEQKRKLKELVKSKKRKDKKRKRGSKYVDDEASASDGEDEDTDAEMEKMTEADHAFLAHEDSSDEETETDSDSSGEDSDSEKSKKKKHKHKKSKKEKRKKRNKREKNSMEVTEAEAEQEEIANHVAEAMASVGSKASKAIKSKKAAKEAGGEDAGGTEKKSKRVCGWCEKDIEKNWQQARGDLTGTGNTWVFFHQECYMPFVNKSAELQAKGEKPPTAKGKGSGKEEKKTEKKAEKKEEKKTEKKAKEAPASKKPKVQANLDKELEKFEKARDGWDRFINHIQDAVSTIDKDLIANEIAVFLKTWAEMDKGMQDIEDGKSDAKTIPGAKGLSDKYQRDLIFFYLMASEHGFKRFKQTIKKNATPKPNGKKA